MSNMGLSLAEFMYVWGKYAFGLGLTPKEFIISQHWAWRYPQAEAGAAIFKMCRQTYSEKVWKAIVTLEAHMDEIGMSNRKKDMLSIQGPAAYCSLHTDSSDFSVSKPGDDNAVRHWYTFKNRKYGMRYAIAVSAESGDLCWVSCGHPAGSISDLNINRQGDFMAELDFFERCGADGAYLCRTDPQYRCPHRKPRNGSLTAKQVEENNDFGGFRSIVENVFSRIKQFACMRSWRHRRHQHPIIARYCFQMTQVKNVHRPVRRIDRDLNREQKVLDSWLAAERHGSAPVVRERKHTPRHAAVAGDTDSDSEEQNAPPSRKRSRTTREMEQLMAVSEQYERSLRSAHQVGERADRSARRARRRENM